MVGPGRARDRLQIRLVPRDFRIPFLHELRHTTNLCVRMTTNYMGVLHRLSLHDPRR